MLEFVFIVLINLGVTFNEGTHYTMSKNLVEKIREAPNFVEMGGDAELSRYVSILNDSKDDIVVTDEGDPIEIK